MFWDILRCSEMFSDSSRVLQVILGQLRPLWEVLVGFWDILRCFNPISTRLSTIPTALWGGVKTINWLLSLLVTSEATWEATNHDKYCSWHLYLSVDSFKKQHPVLHRFAVRSCWSCLVSYRQNCWLLEFNDDLWLNRMRYQKYFFMRRCRKVPIKKSWGLRSVPPWCTTHKSTGRDRNASGSIWLTPLPQCL